MTKTLEVSIETKILIRARELVEQGWVQHTGYSVEERKPHWWSRTQTIEHFCAQTAIGKAAMLLGNAPHIAERILVSAIGCRIIGWNDAFSRTKEDVLAAFDTAIAQSMDVGRLQ